MKFFNEATCSSGGMIWLLLVVCSAATWAEANTIKVPDDYASIQDALDAAQEGDTIEIEPGDYYENETGLFARCGLRIATNQLTIKGQGDFNNPVRLLALEGQEIGIYIAPPSSDPADLENGRECEADKAADSCDKTLHTFKMEGIHVEGFVKHGIQTRWVSDFEIKDCASINNRIPGVKGGNGFYLTISELGVVKDNYSTGSLETALWVSQGKDVLVEDNELLDAPIGLEITVSNNVQAFNNHIHDNTVGVGLFHPSASLNPPLPEMKNWIIADNKIENNNLVNPAAFLPGLVGALNPGIGVLVTGVGDHVIKDNTITGNDSLGVGLVGWCTSMALSGDFTCAGGAPPFGVTNIVVKDNYMKDNGSNPAEPIAAFSGVDLVLLYNPNFGESAEGTCFENNGHEGGPATELGVELDAAGNPSSFLLPLPVC